MRFLLRVWLICLHNYWLDFFYKNLSRQFYLWLPDKHIFPKNVPSIRTAISWSWQKCHLFWLFSIVQLIFLKVLAGCPSSKSYKSVFYLRKLLKLNTLHSGPDKSILPKVFRNHWFIYKVCGKLWKLDSEHYSRFFFNICISWPKTL